MHMRKVENQKVEDEIHLRAAKHAELYLISVQPSSNGQKRTYTVMQSLQAQTDRLSVSLELSGVSPPAKKVKLSDP